MNDRVGYYCWAGPDTIRMTNLKFFNPKIDIGSLMKSYDYEYLAKVKEIFNITDFWASYSWGFSEKSEQEQYDFLLSKLDNFKKLGIKLHAYIQGTNLVYEDYKDKDWFCKDEKGRLVSYYRGRKVVCLNNPEFKNYLIQKIQKTYNLGFDGIFIDNIQMGQIPIPSYSSNQLFTFAGCKCSVCINKFYNDYSKEIPDVIEDLNTSEYLKFRVKSTNQFISEISEIVHKGKMEFGTNSFDPKFNSKEMFGTDIKFLEKNQDYILFENHSLPNERGQNNEYVDKFIEFNAIQKPVFVLSYKKGIGHDSEFNQQDFNNIYTEDKRFKFFSCIKGSEYFTHNIWHNLYLNKLSKPSFNYHLKLGYFEFKDTWEKNLIKIPFLKSLLRKYYNPIYTMRMENNSFRKLLYFFEQLLLK
ncbi:MAG: putative glycoside hydrolase [Candidatus Dojkabacteria bacterium]